MQTVKSLSSVVSMSIFKQDIRVAHEVLPSSIERYSWRVLVLNCLISANSSSLEVSVCVTNNWVNFISSSTAPGYWKEIEFQIFNPVPLKKDSSYWNHMSHVCQCIRLMVISNDHRSSIRHLVSLGQDKAPQEKILKLAIPL